MLKAKKVCKLQTKTNYKYEKNEREEIMLHASMTKP